MFLDPLPVDQPVQISPEVPKMPPGGPVRRRRSARAQGEPPSLARPDRAGLADHRDRLEPVQSASSACHARPGDRLHRQGQRCRRRVQSRADRHRRGCRRSSCSSPGSCGPQAAVRAPSSSRCSAPTTRAARSPGARSVQQGFMGISGINPRRRHIPTDTSYTLAARLTGQARR